MRAFIQNNYKLLRTALISSPLIGIYSVVPIIIFVGSFPGELAVEEFINLRRVSVGVLFISLVVFTIWLINICLLNFFSKKHRATNPPPKWQRYVGSYLLAFTVVLIVELVAEPQRPVENTLVQFYPFVGTFVNNTFILILLELSVAQSERTKLQLEKADLEINHLISQQEQLKQQVHPHFLFNALGTLQILIKKDADTAVDYSGKLAKFLRASLTLAQNNIIPVKEELRLLENYLQLQQVRFANAIVFQIDVPDVVIEEGKLPVFSLQLLVENAIKHNAFSSAEPLQLRIAYEPKGCITVTNNLMPKFTPETSTKIGLTNLKNRFSHFTEQLPEVEETATHFKVTLKVL